MFIGINSPLRRDMLRIALHEFIEGTNTKIGGPQMLSADQARHFADMIVDARKMLREIAASENLLKQPPTHETPTQE